MTVSRMFSSPEDAMGAVAILEAHEFTTDRHIRVVKSTPDYVSGRYLVNRGIYKDHAEGLAARVRAGEILVIVDHPIGYSELTLQLLSSAAPVGEGASPAVNENISYKESTPFSSLMGWPLLSDDPTPFASFWNLPTTGSSFSLSRMLKLDLLTESKPMLGMQALIKSGPILGLKAVISRP